MYSEQNNSEFGLISSVLCEVGAVRLPFRGITYELASQEYANLLAGDSATAFASQDSKIGSADHGTTVYMLVLEVLESEPTSPSYATNVDQSHRIFADISPLNSR